MKKIVEEAKEYRQQHVVINPPSGLRAAKDGGAGSGGSKKRKAADVAAVSASGPHTLSVDALLGPPLAVRARESETPDRTTDGNSSGDE
jgi:hypothetical protein